MRHPRASFREQQVLDRLRDERSGRVMLVSHCLLNENTRYAGGAFRPGAVEEVVDELVRGGYGIHQLPCPEQRAWGGVLKRRVLRAYGVAGSPLGALRGPLLRVFVWWTRLVYARLARRVARDVADYRRAGMEVAGMVGVGASPSCGVHTTVDLRCSLEAMAACPVAQLTREVMNETAVLRCRRPGQGLFIDALDRRLRAQGTPVALLEHDLAAEMRGERWPLR